MMEWNYRILLLIIGIVVVIYTFLTLQYLLGILIVGIILIALLLVKDQTTQLHSADK